MLGLPKEEVGANGGAQYRDQHCEISGLERNLGDDKALGNKWPRNVNDKNDADVCQQRCAAPAELYYYQNPGGAVEQAVSAKSKLPYTSLRTAFRYRYYQSAADIDADLAAFLRHYNFERPHRGYRTAGRRPAELFYAHRPQLLKMKGWDLNEFTLTPKAV